VRRALLRIAAGAWEGVERALEDLTPTMALRSPDLVWMVNQRGYGRRARLILADWPSPTGRRNLVTIDMEACEFVTEDSCPADGDLTIEFGNEVGQSVRMLSSADDFTLTFD